MDNEILSYDFKDEHFVSALIHFQVTKFTRHAPTLKVLKHVLSHFQLAFGKFQRLINFLLRVMIDVRETAFMLFLNRIPRQIMDGLTPHQCH